jgi:glycosyltransferase involved in cell wall biosynthesis
VAIASRNYGRYLRQSVGSALRAAARLPVPYEVVVVDDASTDDTREILEELRLAAPDRLKIFVRKTTRGIAVAKNTAMALCSGRYIAWLDADDEFLEEKLVATYAWIAQGTADFVTHDFIDREGANVQVLTQANWSAIDFDYWPPSTWVFINGTVRHQNLMCGGCEDLEWLIRAQPHLRRGHVPQVLTTRTVHRDSTGMHSDSAIASHQSVGRLRGQPHHYDSIAPIIYRCARCGRQSLLPARCCGEEAQAGPIFFGSVAESPTPTPTDPEFSFIFLVKNQFQRTRVAVESLLSRLADTRAELVFVDGGSTDETVEQVRRWSAVLPVKLTFATPGETFNYSRSANRGVRASCGEYVILVNNDVEVLSDGIIETLRAALSDARVGVVGVSTSWNEAQCDPPWDTSLSRYVFTNRPQAGFFWGTRREVFWELGALDEVFSGWGYEELDFAYRALLANYRMAIAAGRVAHHPSTTFKAEFGESAMRELEIVNRRAFERKFGRAIYTQGSVVEPFASYAVPSISAVMVVHENGPALRATLEAAAADPRAHDGSSQLVIVHKRPSTDETALLLAQYRRRLPRLLSVIEPPEPVEDVDARALGRARAIGRTVVEIAPGARLPTGHGSPIAGEQRLGRWEVRPESAEVLAVHAALLTTGKVLYFGGSEYDETQLAAGEIDHTRIWDPATYAVERIPSPPHDTFCAGHAFLRDGRLLVAGGTSDYGEGIPDEPHSHSSKGGRAPAGLRDCAIFDPSVPRGRNPWTVATPMNPERGKRTGGGRWYPTLSTLPDGTIMAWGALPGQPDSRGVNTMLELFDPLPHPRGRWHDLGDQPLANLAYPRTHLLPDGHLLSATTMGFRIQKWHPGTGRWTHVAGPPGMGYDFDPDLPPEEFWMSSILLPLAPPDYHTRVLLVGRQVTRLLDLGPRGERTNVGWTDTAPRTLPGVPGRHGPSPIRWDANYLLLPDGSILAVGGTVDKKDAHAVRAAERFDPDADRWETLAEATVPRGYHSTALLLPDGRVWTAGSNVNGKRGRATRELRIEIFSPPYLFRGPRPVIAEAPAALAVGTQFVVRTPHAARIRSVAVLRHGSATHGFDADQRCIRLAILDRGSSTLTLAAPPDTKVAPPGYYMLFLVAENGVPSVARILRIGA